MSFRLGINGFGRIGRCVLRALYERQLQDQLEIVVINEPTDLETLRYLAQYDSTHGRFPGSLTVQDEQLGVNGRFISVLNSPDLHALSWHEHQLDLLLECSGTYSERVVAEQQIEQGAGRILLSHPAQADVDATIILGFNESSLTGQENIVSAGSCSTSCAIPVLKALDQHFGIERGVTTTIHSAMNDQPVIDGYHNNLCLTRAAVSSIIPVDTQLPKGIERFMPHLQGRFESLHVRVPTLNVSVMDLSLQLRQAVTVEQVNQVLRAESERIPQVLGFSLEPHASVDFNHDPRSGIVDATQTRVSDGHLVKVFVWFDNEWGFANRMVDTALAWLNQTKSL